MGKAKALRLGIVRGVQHVASVVLPQTYKCPVCKHQFTAYEVALEAKETGLSAEEIVAGHIKNCIASRFPNQKSECLMCKEKGKTTKLKISELDEHIAKCHSDADSSDRNSVSAESQSSTPITEVERDVKDSPITSDEGNYTPAMLTSVFSTEAIHSDTDVPESGSTEIPSSPVTEEGASTALATKESQSKQSEHVDLERA